jgi:predicted metal-dependent phosphoesterase TrpH
MIRADLHIHTKYSPDASIPPKTIVEQLHAHPYIKAAAITDHNTVQGSHKAQKLASTYPDILIIPAVEITTNYGDLIVLGVAELPPEPYTVENVIEFAKEKEALTIAAHPYRTRGLGDLTKNYDVDAIEILNSISSPNVNKMAEDLAKEMALPGVAGSDAHQVNELWTAYTEIQASSNIDEILKAIKKGLVKAVSTGKSVVF